MYYNQLSVQEKTLVEQQVTNNQKSMIVAYILWFFLGMTGAHRFYASKGKGTAIIQFVTFIIGFLTTFIFIGTIILFFLGIWILIDAFLIPGMIRKQTDKLRESLSKDMLQHNGGRYNNTQDEDFGMDF